MSTINRAISVVLTNLSYDNVGGEILDVVLANMKIGGRISKKS